MFPSLLQARSRWPCHTICHLCITLVVSGVKCLTGVGTAAVILSIPNTLKTYTPGGTAVAARAIEVLLFHTTPSSQIWVLKLIFDLSQMLVVSFHWYRYSCIPGTGSSSTWTDSDEHIRSLSGTNRKTKIVAPFPRTWGRNCTWGVMASFSWSMHQAANLDHDTWDRAQSSTSYMITITIHMHIFILLQRCCRSTTSNTQNIRACRTETVEVGSGLLLVVGQTRLKVIVLFWLWCPQIRKELL